MPMPTFHTPFAELDLIRQPEQRNDPLQAFDAADEYLLRQVACIGGGTTEMARNVISERVLGMPRESSGDRDIAFRDVPRSSSSKA